MVLWRIELGSCLGTTLVPRTPPIRRFWGLNVKPDRKMPHGGRSMRCKGSLLRAKGSSRNYGVTEWERAKKWCLPPQPLLRLRRCLGSTL